MDRDITPSGWHDDARGRDAGHDQLQIEVWRYLKEHGETEAKAKSYPLEEYRRTSVDVEHPFVVGGRISVFADVCEVFVHSPMIGNDIARRRHLFRIFEIKPKVWSAGAAIRQATAIYHAVWKWRESREAYQPPLVSVAIVVPFDDPKLLLLREMYHGQVWAWKDGGPI